MGRYLEQLDLGLDLTPTHRPHRGPSPGGNRQLAAWAADSEGSRRPQPGRDRAGEGAFYGRVSTVECQDAGSSLGWQRDSASDVIADRGRIVAEYFDVGYSRTVPWARRRQVRGDEHRRPEVAGYRDHPDQQLRRPVRQLGVLL